MSEILKNIVSYKQNDEKEALALKQEYHELESHKINQKKLKIDSILSNELIKKKFDFIFQFFPQEILQIKLYELCLAEDMAYIEKNLALPEELEISENNFSNFEKVIFKLGDMVIANLCKTMANSQSIKTCFDAKLKEEPNYTSLVEKHKTINISSKKIMSKAQALLRQSDYQPKSMRELVSQAMDIKCSKYLESIVSLSICEKANEFLSPEKIKEHFLLKIHSLESSLLARDHKLAFKPQAWTMDLAEAKNLSQQTLKLIEKEWKTNPENILNLEDFFLTCLDNTLNKNLYPWIDEQNPILLPKQKSILFKAIMLNKEDFSFSMLVKAGFLQTSIDKVVSAALQISDSKFEDSLLQAAYYLENLTYDATMQLLAGFKNIKSIDAICQSTILASLEYQNIYSFFSPDLSNTSENNLEFEKVKAQITAPTSPLISAYYLANSAQEDLMNSQNIINLKKTLIGNILEIFSSPNLQSSE